MKNKQAKSPASSRLNEVLETIRQDRTRTNLTKTGEQKLIAWLVQRIPSWISSDMLTGIGLFGNLTVAACFILAFYVNRYFLLVGLLGFAINWFGDSLDGRLAYYRNNPKRLYGFILDITIDWIGIIFIGCGFIVYVEGTWELIGYAFVLLYGWEMIVAQMRYRITGTYIIDSGKLGPTETRMILCLLLITELVIPGSIKYFALFITALLLSVNIMDTRYLLKIALKKDLEENRQREAGNQPE